MHLSSGSLPADPSCCMLSADQRYHAVWQNLDLCVPEHCGSGAWMCFGYVCAFAHLRIASTSCAARRHVQLAVTRLDNHIITCSFSLDRLTTGPGRECLDMVKANGFDVEENPLGGLQLTAVPISKNTTFGVCPTMAAELAGAAGLQVTT